MTPTQGAKTARADLPATRPKTDEPARVDVRRSSGGVVAAGLGAAAGTGLVAFGLYKLGERAGWWGDPSTIVIDDPADSGGDQSGGGESNSGGGSKSSTIAIGNPPNMSGDAEGYNTSLFPSPAAVRLALKSLGYDVEFEAAPLVGYEETHGEVQRFQTDWNRVIKAIDTGKISLPKSVKSPEKLAMYRGLLSVDDIPGKYTLRAIEIAIRNALTNLVKFTKMREESKR
ncbi:hypothetical protein G6O69_37965 [Pseudenhygromyxa sp. WMMC2535]|uniref:hypothetical protein n=1 Tax=Pseudenhygromyxa sp. WMMC2535 TaxID=2712867 RepID=UPI001557F6CF|nr:hypothetical protein [Pseudenhygromyxa sp. WMMC2535]NVB37236.1 hypothetical protein [Pseudenhygromyxa sp. WMMC2535]NVB38210.1 hypothetical protein [Pseudenhygromyxa sp. WMMC2535]NVB41609.1 hypothetical protein [Pseudenhygromyxa sp. WMMC2535]NVB43452.1 hypothetical protein [Pseudenhygromyxa sp. WMMC2535]NVB43633.1 hypothetical protein [Pseudenhygromyxa sp. WMMC2535]